MGLLRLRDPATGHGQLPRLSRLRFAPVRRLRQVPLRSSALHGHEPDLHVEDLEVRRQR